MFRSKRILCGVAALLLVPALLALPLSVAALEDAEPVTEDSLCLQETPVQEELAVHDTVQAFSDIETEILPIEEDDPVWTRYEEDDPLLYFRDGWSRIEYYSAPTAAFSGSYASRAFSTQASLVFTFTGSAVQIGTYCNTTQGSLLISVDDDPEETLDLTAPLAACGAMFVQLEEGKHSVSIHGDGTGPVWIDYIDIADGSLLETSVAVDRRTMDDVTIEESEFSLTGNWEVLSNYTPLTNARAVRTKDSDAVASYSFRGYNAMDLVSYRSPNYGSCKVTLTRMSDGATVDSAVTDLSLTPAADTEYQYYLYSFDGLNPAERYTVTLSVDAPGRVWNALLDALKLYREKDLEVADLLPFSERAIYATLDAPHKAAYRAIFDAAITLDRGYIDLGATSGVPVEDISMLLRAVRDDFPEIFWLPQVYASGTSGDKTILTFYYDGGTPDQSVDYLVADAAALKTAYLALLKRVDETINSQTDSGMDEYEITLALHDWLCENGTYDFSYSAEEFSWDVYGILMNGTGVCESYARSYQLLLQETGIESRVVYGVSVSETPENHAWNAVKIDGNWYYTDVTWDDSAVNTLDYTHVYCNTTAEWLARDHVTAGLIEDPAEAQELLVNFFVPECTATAANYYVKSGTMVSSATDLKTVMVAAFSARKTSEAVEFFLGCSPDLTPADFDGLLKEYGVIAGIASALKLSPLSYTYCLVPYDQPVVIMSVS